LNTFKEASIPPTSDTDDPVIFRFPPTIRQTPAMKLATGFWPRYTAKRDKREDAFYWNVYQGS
jgi:hypothetical protein